MCIHGVTIATSHFSPDTWATAIKAIASNRMAQ
jgi:hypothetical protein